MSVFFERLGASPLKATRQGIAITGLVHREAEWLQEDRPLTVHRYRDIQHGIHNTRRIAQFNPRDCHPYVLREENKRGAPLGLATLVSTQLISHPEHGLVKGTDVDYWLLREAADETDLHSEVAAKLLTLSGTLALKREGVESVAEFPGMVLDLDEGEAFGVTAMLPVVRATNKAFMTVIEGQINPPTGLIGYMEAIGEPAVLRVPRETDQYELARDGRPAQLYYHELPIELPQQFMQP